MAESEDFLVRIARTLGKMTVEAEQAYKEAISEGPTPKSAEQLLVELAAKVGVDARGKTLAQVSDEIAKKIPKENPSK